MDGLGDTTISHIRLGLILDDTDSAVNIRLIHVDSQTSFTFYKAQTNTDSNNFDWGDVSSGGLDGMVYFNDFGDLPFSDYEPSSLPDSIEVDYYSLEGSFDETFYNLTANTEWQLEFFFYDDLRSNDGYVEVDTIDF